MTQYSFESHGDRRLLLILRKPLLKVANVCLKSPDNRGDITLSNPLVNVLRAVHILGLDRKQDGTFDLARVVGVREPLPIEIISAGFVHKMHRKHRDESFVKSEEATSRCPPLRPRDSDRASCPENKKPRGDLIHHLRGLIGLGWTNTAG